ncbi:hypothetical protein GCM10012288_20590 [Malaciobacter pacificus]|uniref:Transcriptional regulator, MarR family n=1 Tax=Malaciobacter pacificus TaxID=1080223 RepID=A0A5C2HB77_9BACT|nr:MarR family transcriptional regulator [Malaciobacter pacificus]QEP35619.1 transcriptional regulator, MarR family [Malaciobacter pacificus]GGD46205.1 hypothetical protein GCM10012288_20590 [Malaciobacter pacificus]
MENKLLKSIGFNVNLTANLLNSSINQILHKYSIAIEQRVLLEIIKYEDQVNQTRIAQILRKDKTTISRTLKTLENKGYISKYSIDKRTNVINLTPLGEEILEQTEKEVKIFRDKISSKLSNQEIEQLFTTLDKVVYALSE